jgi:hypothetical protein
VQFYSENSEYFALNTAVGFLCLSIWLDLGNLTVIYTPTAADNFTMTQKPTEKQVP